MSLITIIERERGGVSSSHVDILSSPASSLTRRSVLFGKDIAKGDKIDHLLFSQRVQSQQARLMPWNWSHKVRNVYDPSIKRPKPHLSQRRGKLDIAGPYC